MSLRLRTDIVKTIHDLSEQTDIRENKIASFIELSRSTLKEWEKRSRRETRHNHMSPRPNWYTPEETEKAVQYITEHKEDLFGYRNLAWHMIDENIVCIRPASVYSLMKKHNLIYRWAEKGGEAHKKGFDQPSKPNEQWHTDISYIKVLGNYYYFISVMDGYSRKILGWNLVSNMEGINIELLITKMKEKYPEAHARVIHDNGKQFVSRDFRELISALELRETAARVCHPQSNGKLERFHKTLKGEHVRRTPYFSYEDAKQKMSKWIEYYNTERLHGGLYYLTPEDYFTGRKDKRLEERREKLHIADEKRKAYWQSLKA